MNALELSDDLYIRFRDLLHSRCGLDYPERKRGDLAHSLSLALIETRHHDLGALYAAAVSGGPAWDTLVAHVTIGETYFFRNIPQFTALRDHIVPEVIARRSTTRGLRLWSAGCATGEEPYSLAMLAADLLPDREAWQLSILGTDINLDFLARAQEGLYGSWSFRETPDAVRAHYFRPEAGRWRLCPEIRRMVRFMRLNLVENSYPAIANGTCALDIILCRNVTIYFDADTTRQVVSRLYQALVPGGWLIVGHAEPQASMYQQFEVHNFPDTVVYRKPLNAPLFAFDAARGTFTAGATPVLGATPRPPGSRPTSPPAAKPQPTVVKTINPQPAPAKEIPPTDVAALVQQARQAANRCDWAAAEEQCTVVIARDPLCRDAHYLLGQIHEHQNRLDEALAAYRRSVYLDRTFVVGTLGMAQVWQAMGRPADAQRCYRNVLKQLSQQPGSTPVPGANGETYADLVSLVSQQLVTLEAQIVS